MIRKPNFSLAFIINPKKRLASLKLTIILNRKCLYSQQYLPNQIHNTINIKISKLSNRFNNLFHLYFKACCMGTIFLLNFLWCKIQYFYYWHWGFLTPLQSILYSVLLFSCFCCYCVGSWEGGWGRGVGEGGVVRVGHERVRFWGHCVGWMLLYNFYL